MRILFRIVLFPIGLVLIAISVVLNLMLHISSWIAGFIVNFFIICAIIAAFMNQWQNMIIFGILTLIVVALFYGSGIIISMIDDLMELIW